MSYYSQNSPYQPPYQADHPPQQATQNDDFAPPTGPPPGWHQFNDPNPNIPSTSSYFSAASPHQRPNSSHYPSGNHNDVPQPQNSNDYSTSNHGHLAPRSMNVHPQQQQEQEQHPFSSHSRPNSRPSSVSMIFPPSMYAWWNSDSKLGTFIELGLEPKGEALFSAKLSMSSGKVTLRREKFKHNGQQLAEAKLKNTLSSKYIIKLPSGLEVEYGSSFHFMYKGQREEWKWGTGGGKSFTGKITEKLTGKMTGKEKSYQLTGQTSGTMAAVFIGEGHSFNDISATLDKNKFGRFEFQGPVLSGELGNDFATVALVAFAKLKQREVENRLLDAVFEMGG
ncbi:unnamed protein product [Clonostachys rhizophaga]|uniref:Uncharacterized protein n=1 Tax=Clonostachys rhizophaga TaxID=160324 RepID=A0A9N9VP14_9HYPO|nr:unnamed protein product [Clonostachys rhizophaga]